MSSSSSLSSSSLSLWSVPHHVFSEIISHLSLSHDIECFLSLLQVDYRVQTATKDHLLYRDDKRVDWKWFPHALFFANSCPRSSFFISFRYSQKHLRIAAMAVERARHQNMYFRFCSITTGMILPVPLHAFMFEFDSFYCEDRGSKGYDLSLLRRIEHAKIKLDDWVRFYDNNAITESTPHDNNIGVDEQDDDVDRNNNNNNRNYNLNKLHERTTFFQELYPFLSSLSIFDILIRYPTLPVLNALLSNCNIHRLQLTFITDTRLPPLHHAALIQRACTYMTKLNHLELDGSVDGSLSRQTIDSIGSLQHLSCLNIRDILVGDVEALARCLFSLRFTLSFFSLLTSEMDVSQLFRELNNLYRVQSYDTTDHNSNNTCDKVETFSSSLSPFSSLSSPSPLNQLHLHIEDGRIDRDSMHTISLLYPRITNLELVVSPASGPCFEHFSLPHLTQLRLLRLGRHPEVIQSLQVAIPNLPALKTLDIYNEFPLEDEENFPLPCLSISSPLLEYLTAANNLRIILRDCPHLRDVRAYYIPFDRLVQELALSHCCAAGKLTPTVRIYEIS
eukprot:TRINITY_DN10507_c0_g3_i1.p1 TRINITY_DN10507_c0_g3~~TRINITY_DN10507_c0_g3_i1.p1  ORF type:complete len:592 (+),score=71.16 TRINITY_DN10507_c0_g3_i1:93-1778(+)